MAKKKLKKFLKKAAKAALIGGALYGATKLGRRRATDAPGNAFAKAKRLMTSDRAYTGKGYDDPIMTGGVGVKASRLPTWNQDQRMVDNDPFNYYKKGGRVTGIAKRGFGRALMKGKK